MRFRILCVMKNNLNTNVFPTHIHIRIPIQSYPTECSQDKRACWTGNIRSARKVYRGASWLFGYCVISSSIGADKMMLALALNDERSYPLFNFNIIQTPRDVTAFITVVSFVIITIFVINLQ